MKYRIITCNDEPYKGMCFYVANNTKQWITSIAAANDKGLDMRKLEVASPDELKQYKNGRLLIRNINSLDDISTYFDARAYLLKDLYGIGIEFGAATAPSCVPDGCIVEYADFFEQNEGCNNNCIGDFVDVKYKTGLEEMVGIQRNSLDFIIHCHVIEHVSKTILAIENCYNALKMGGVLFMAIPHMRYTFDSLRPLTTINHFISDYNSYSHEQDLLHLVDFLENTRKYELQSGAENTGNLYIYENLNEFVNGKKIDLHYHTFTEKNFSELMDYINNNVVRWSKTEIIPRIPFKDSNEFYVRLTK